MKNNTEMKKTIFSKWWFLLIFLFVLFVVFLSILPLIFPETFKKLEQERIEAEKRKNDSLEAIEKEKAFRLEQERIANLEMINIQNYLNNNILIKNWSWSIGGFGNVGIVDITFQNTSDTIVYKDISVTVEFKGESGLVLSSETRVIPVVVPPKSYKKVNDINFGFINSQSKKANISINHFKIDYKKKGGKKL